MATKRKITGYLAMRLWRELQTNMGPLPLNGLEKDLVGVVPVYRTKTAARKVYGRDVELRSLKLLPETAE